MKQLTNKRLLVINLEIFILIILIFSIYKVFSTDAEYSKADSEYERVNKVAKIEKGVDFEALKKENSDTVGWIYVQDTNINYPIMKGKDNKFYLKHLFNKTYNNKGSIFVDYRNNVFKDFVTIVYGHRVEDGSMFEDLTKFRNKEFFDNHISIFLATPDRELEAEVVAVANIRSNSKLYKLDNISKDDYLDQVKKASLFSRDLSLDSDDRLVILSTCSYERKNARLVVFIKIKGSDYNE